MESYEGVPKEAHENEEEVIEAQVKLWKQIFGFAETIMLRCAVQLGIPDLIHEQGPMTLTELASKLQVTQKAKNMEMFQHTMRFFVNMDLFTLCEENSKYGLTPMSKLLLRADHDDSNKKKKKKSLASFVLSMTHPVQFSLWEYLLESLQGSTTNTYWESKYGIKAYEFIGKDPEMNKLMNESMRSHSECVVEALVNGLKKEKVLDDVTTLVDVGGNSGVVAKAILESFPHLIKCTVMDLLHVIQSVSKDNLCPKIDFLAGDMFESIPSADVILLKSTLHSHDDDACIKTLSKCKEAIDSRRGKVVLVEIVLDADTLPEFTHARLSMDMEMMLMGGKERTKQEWEHIFHKAGFNRHELIPIKAMESVIVVYP